MNHELANIIADLVQEQSGLDADDVRESLRCLEEAGVLKQYINIKGLTRAVEQDLADA